MPTFSNFCEIQNLRLQMISLRYFLCILLCVYNLRLFHHKSFIEKRRNTSCYSVNLECDYMSLDTCNLFRGFKINSSVQVQVTKQKGKKMMATCLPSSLEVCCIADIIAKYPLECEKVALNK